MEQPGRQPPQGPRSRWPLTVRERERRASDALAIPARAVVAFRRVATRVAAPLRREDAPSLLRGERSQGERRMRRAPSATLEAVLAVASIACRAALPEGAAVSVSALEQVPRWGRFEVTFDAPGALSEAIAARFTAPSGQRDAGGRVCRAREIPRALRPRRSRRAPPPGHPRRSGRNAGARARVLPLGGSPRAGLRAPFSGAPAPARLRGRDVLPAARGEPHQHP